MMDIISSDYCVLCSMCGTTSHRMFWDVTKMRIMSELSTVGSLCLESSINSLLFPHDVITKLRIQLPPIPLMEKSDAYTRLPIILNMSRATWSISYFKMYHQL